MPQSDHRLGTRPTTISAAQHLADRLQRIRQRLSRRSMLTFLLASVVAATCYGITRRAQNTISGLGTSATIHVVTRDLPSGHVLEQTDVQPQERPVAFTPNDATTSARVGETLTADVYAGEVLLRARVQVGTLGMDASELALTVPLPLAPPPVSPGDSVYVVSVLPSLDPIQPVTQSLTPATVLQVSDDGITVAIADYQIGPVVEALSIGAIEILIRPG